MSSPIFSTEYLAELLALPEVATAREKLTSGKKQVYFNTTVTDTLRSALLPLGLDVPTATIPMRWIQGDTPAHIDSGPSAFENTYLVYLTDSPGEFIINHSVHPIRANTAFVFNEGVRHETQGTGNEPRLLLGPMNEFGQAVGGGGSIFYFSSYNDALAGSGVPPIASSESLIIGTISGASSSGSIGSYTSWQIAIVSGPDTPPLTVYANGTDLTTSGLGFPIHVYPAVDPASVNIYYYSNYAHAFAHGNNNIAETVSFLVGDVSTGSIGSYTSWRIAYMGDGSIPPPSTVYSNGINLVSFGNLPVYLYPVLPCFLEGTTVLCYRDGIEAYIPIETMTRGTVVVTPEGYKKVELIGKGTIVNRGDDERVQDRLYRCPVTNYMQLTNDLYLTGCHSILVPNLTDKQRRKTEEIMKRVFITGNKYRLLACIDERAEPWVSEGTYTIWHLALENKDIISNYGIYVNGGLLVETCCIQRMKNKSNLTLC